MTIPEYDECACGRRGAGHDCPIRGEIEYLECGCLLHYAGREYCWTCRTRGVVEPSRTKFVPKKIDKS